MKHFLVAALSAALLSATALAASPWDGAYLYEQPIGPGAGGLQLFVNHTLTIGANSCRIDAEGYQTYEKIRCKATPNGDRLDVFFVSYDDGKLVNMHGVKIYDPNQKLFTLTHKGNAVWTEWAGYARNKHIGPPEDETFKKVKM
ncbi:MAG TPA: DUF5991 domain-containing protein [Reyranella sp.]|nr:DUF5991 domain-containing protein [Reyranella sp.]